MGYRNSVLEIDKSIGEIPDKNWEKFFEHAREMSHYLPGHFTFAEDGRSFDLRYGESESLFFSKSVTGKFDDTDYYIIHKTSWRDSYFGPAIAAMFMLFAQDCGVRILNCQVGPAHYGDCFTDAQDALETLMDAGVWEGGKPCLITRDELEPDIRKATQSIYAALEREWLADGFPGAAKIMEIAEAECEKCAPRFRNELMEDWKALALSESRVASSHDFGVVRLQGDDGPEKIYFPDRHRAERYAQQKAISLGISFDSIGKSDDPAGEQLPFAVGTAAFRDLPQEGRPLSNTDREMRADAEVEIMASRKDFDALCRKISAIVASDANHGRKEGCAESIAGFLRNSGFDPLTQLEALWESRVRSCFVYDRIDHDAGGSPILKSVYPGDTETADIADEILRQPAIVKFLESRGDKSELAAKLKSLCDGQGLYLGGEIEASINSAPCAVILERMKAMPDLGLAAVEAREEDTLAPCF